MQILLFRLIFFLLDNYIGKNISSLEQAIFSFFPETCFEYLFYANYLHLNYTWVLHIGQGEKLRFWNNLRFLYGKRSPEL